MTDANLSDFVLVLFFFTFSQRNYSPVGSTTDTTTGPTIEGFRKDIFFAFDNAIELGAVALSLTVLRAALDL